MAPGNLSGLNNWAGRRTLVAGFLQRTGLHVGNWPGLFLVAGLYAAVHLTSRNPVLILAALVCGLVWGYQYLKFKSVLANIVSHILFDLAVFLFFPF
jgi:membrane protease YdiL (CAAX protease family)